MPQPYGYIDIAGGGIIDRLMFRLYAPWFPRQILRGKLIGHGPGVIPSHLCHQFPVIRIFKHGIDVQILIDSLCLLRS